MVSTITYERGHVVDEAEFADFMQARDYLVDQVAFVKRSDPNGPDADPTWDRASAALARLIYPGRGERLVVAEADMRWEMVVA